MSQTLGQKSIYCYQERIYSINFNPVCFIIRVKSEWSGEKFDKGIYRVQSRNCHESLKLNKMNKWCRREDEIDELSLEATLKWARCRQWAPFHANYILLSQFGKHATNTSEELSAQSEIPYHASKSLNVI